MGRFLFTVSLIALLAFSPAFGAESPAVSDVPWSLAAANPAPTSPSTEGADQARDALHLGHDYLAAGLALRGPLGSLDAMLRQRTAQGDFFPNLSIQYVYRTLDGEAHTMTLKSQGSLHAFVEALRAHRAGSAEDIRRHELIDLTGVHRIKASNCQRTGLTTGALRGEKLDLDHALSQGDRHAVAVAFGRFMTLIVLGEPQYLLFGPIRANVAHLDEITGSCTMSFDISAQPMSRAAPSRQPARRLASSR